MPTDDGSARRATRLLWATLVAGLLVLLAGVGEARAGLNAVFGESASRTLEVGIESCNARPRVEVEETAAQVRLTAFVDRPGILDGSNDCLDHAAVTLGAPLGTRVGVDGSSGDVVALSAPD